MSNQVYSNQQDPYWLSSRGVNAVQFNKLDNPPIAYLNKGILYELVDGKLYFNGNELAYATSEGTARALATTGADVNVDESDPPVAGDFLVSTDPTHAIWSNSVLGSNFFVGGADPTNRIAFTPGGTGETTTQLVTNATFDRTINLPDANTNLIGCADIVAADVVPKFASTSPSNLISSGVRLRATGTNSLALTDQPMTVSGTDEYSTVVGSQLTSAPLTARQSSVVLASRSIPSIGALNQSILIGSTLFYQGTVNKTLARQLIIGDTFGANGTYTGTQTTGNIVMGSGTGYFVTSADNNVSIGHGNMYQSTSASANVLVGHGIGFAMTTGSQNVFVGAQVGQATTTGSGNTYVGFNLSPANESNTVRVGNATSTACYINGIRGVNPGAGTLNVVINAAGQLGTNPSARRFKENIQTYTPNLANYDALRPVSFDYIEYPGSPMLGLIAEEVEPLYPDMCVYQPDGNGGQELISVDYSRLHTMTLAQVQHLDSLISGDSATTTVGKAGSSKMFVNGVYGAVTDIANAIPVIIDADGQIGTVPSSLRFKENVETFAPLNSFDQLRPVEFNYKGSDKRSLGLIAEEVEQVYPEMCVYETYALPESSSSSEDFSEIIESPPAEGTDDDPYSRAEEGSPMGLPKLKPASEPKTRARNSGPKLGKRLLTVDYTRLSIVLLAEVQQLKKVVTNLSELVTSLLAAQPDDVRFRAKESAQKVIAQSVVASSGGVINFNTVG